MATSARVRWAVLALAMLAAGVAWRCTALARGSDAGGARWTTAYAPGHADTSGRRMGGTELRALVPFDGKLYAGIGYWEDTAEGDPATRGSTMGLRPVEPGSAPYPGAQVLALDREDGPWRVDLELDEVVPRGRHQGKRRHFAVGALEALALTTDGSGAPLAQPARFLAAGPWSHVPGIDVYVRGQATGWTKTTLGLAQGNVRSFGQHVNRATGVSRAFAGSEPLGIFSGTYDPASRTIVWQTTPEAWFQSGERDDSPPDGWRVMAFQECGNKLYATAGPALYERTDGPTPVWKKVFTADFPPDVDIKGNGGLRGMQAIADPQGPGETLLVAAGGRTARVLRVDPARGFAASVDVDVVRLLSSASGTPVQGALLAYNHMTPASDPRTGEQVLLVGLQSWTRAEAGPKWHRFDARATYLVRHADGAYDVHHMEDADLAAPPPRVSVRTLALSPFAPGVLYAGGFDANKHPVHDTAWALRGPLGMALERPSRR